MRFLFDECVGKPVLEQIAKALALTLDDSVLAHILDYQKSGTFDQDWIPQLAEAGNWIVISADRGGRGRKQKGEKLQVVCKKYGITLVELSQKIHHMNSLEKMAIILSVWPSMKLLGDAPAGSRHLIKLSGKTRTPTLVQIDPPLGETKKRT